LLFLQDDERIVTPKRSMSSNTSSITQTAVKQDKLLDALRPNTRVREQGQGRRRKFLDIAAQLTWEETRRFDPSRLL